MITTGIDSSNNSGSMIKEVINIFGIDVTAYILGNLASSKNTIILAHGWGQSSSVFFPLMDSLRNHTSLIAIDFPGFGASNNPPADWSVTNYCDLSAKIIQHFHLSHCIWVGHSFGCRVGIKLAANYPELVDSLILIAAPGIPYKNILQKMKISMKIMLFKALKFFIPEGLGREKLRIFFGSSDYRSAGSMRSILAKVLSENLSNDAKKIKCNVVLMYGANDFDTPPRIGELYTQLIPTANLIILKGFDHNSIIQTGYHQISLEIHRLLKGVA
ncbi:AB hydrolase-1 domain-containing protein [Gammaproteobacteria bacterium]